MGSGDEEEKKKKSKSSLGEFERLKKWLHPRVCTGRALAHTHQCKEEKKTHCTQMITDRWLFNQDCGLTRIQ